MEGEGLVHERLHACQETMEGEGLVHERLHACWRRREIMEEVEASLY